MSVDQPNQFRLQDGHLITRVSPVGEPHAQERWEQRAPSAYADESIRPIWRCAEPVEWSGTVSDAYARVHIPSKMLLIAEYGVIMTAFPLDDLPAGERQQLLKQVGAEVDDDA